MLLYVIEVVLSRCIQQCSMVRNVDQGLKLKLLRGPNEGLPGNQRAALSLPKGCIMTLTQQWRYLNFAGNSFYILLPA